MRDRVTAWPFAVGIVAFHILAFVFDRFLDDSPGSGVAFALFGGPAFLVAGVTWLVFSVVFLIHRHWRLALSWLIGPIAGFAAGIVMARGSYPPWRVWFEVMRPYYIAQVWTAVPGSESRNTVVFTQVDKELWSGHETRQIIYDGDVSARQEPRTPGWACHHDHWAEWTRYTNLGFGFYAKEVVASYVDPCPKEG